MSRIRSIKPEFWTSAQILECSTNARLMFIGLWNFCDDAGRHPAIAKQIKAEIFPADPFSETDVAGMLQELSRNALITFYQFENKEYFYVNGWKHQRIDKPQTAKYPDPFSEHSTTVPRTFPPDTIGEDKKGEDSKRMRANARPARGTRLSEDWQPDEAGIAYAIKFNVNHQSEAEAFRDYWRAKAGPNAVKLDWAATWRTWCRNSMKFKGGNGNGQAPRRNGIQEVLNRKLAELGGEEGARNPVRDNPPRLLPFRGRE